MRWLARAAFFVGLFVPGLMLPAAAGHASGGGDRHFSKAVAPTDFSAQRRARAQRRQPRILVYPAPPPRYVRRCRDWYVVEPRASGPTVVPHTRCWWVRG